MSKQLLLAAREFPTGLVYFFQSPEYGSLGFIQPFKHCSTPIDSLSSNLPERLPPLSGSSLTVELVSWQCVDVLDASQLCMESLASVGMFAIQLARIAGYEVLAVASKKPELAKSLGANAVVDVWFNLYSFGKAENLFIPCIPV